MGRVSRERIFQQPPDPDRDYRGFPRRTLAAGMTWFRQHAASCGPWWFSCSGAGRFDLADPYGTCYLAASPQSAVREGIGPDLAEHGQVPASLIDGRVVSALPLPETVTAANVDSPRAVDHYGVTAELTAMTPYDVPQAWANTLHRAGFDAVIGRLRFAGARDRGLALFGEQGHRTAWPTDPHPVTARGVAARQGITIVDPPATDQITIVGSPGSAR